MKPSIIRTGLIATLAAATIFAVAFLYSVAPCHIFRGWYDPTLFYAYVWPALIPGSLLLAALHIAMGARQGWRPWIMMCWAVLFTLVLYGWWHGFLQPYTIWKAEPNSVWPAQC